MSIYEKTQNLIEKYKDTLAIISENNPKENGETYDLGVCFDMLKANYKAWLEGKEIPYAMDEGFDFEAFGKDIAEE